MALINPEEVYAEVTAQVLEHADDDMPPSAMCLYYGVFAVEAIRRRGQRAILQAGSASWRMVSEELDDGITQNAFSYMWDPAAAPPIIAAGKMPEMHVWAATIEPPAIIDLASGHFPAQAQRLLGLEWRAARPPTYLWEEAPTGCRYEPELDAVRVALWFAARLFGIDRARALVS